MRRCVLKFFTSSGIDCQPCCPSSTQCPCKYAMPTFKDIPGKVLMKSSKVFSGSSSTRKKNTYNEWERQKNHANPKERQRGQEKHRNVVCRVFLLCLLSSSPSPSLLLVKLHKENASEDFGTISVHLDQPRTSSKLTIKNPQIISLPSHSPLGQHHCFSGEIQEVVNSGQMLPDTRWHSRISRIKLCWIQSLFQICIMKQFMFTNATYALITLLRAHSCILIFFKLYFAKIF